MRPYWSLCLWANKYRAKMRKLTPEEKVRSKELRKAYHARWRKENPSKLRAYWNAWRKKHPEKVREKRREWRNRHQDEVRRRNREYIRNRRRLDLPFRI